MALRCDHSSSFSSVNSFSHYAITKTTISEALIRKPPIHRISTSAPAARFYPVLRTVRCCRSSVSVAEDEKYLSTRIFIKGLAQSTSEGTLNKTFSQFGNVTRVKIITDRKSRLSLGFAYIWFTSEDSAQLAVKEMDGKFLDGRFVSVTIAKPESPTSQKRVTTYHF